MVEGWGARTVKRARCRSASRELPPTSSSKSPGSTTRWPAASTMVHAETGTVDAGRDRLAGWHRDAAERLELLGRPRDARDEVGHIGLHDLVCRPVARVGHRDPGGDDVVARHLAGIERQVGPVDGGVGQALSEDELGVLREVCVAVAVLATHLVVVGRLLPHVTRHRDGQPAEGLDVAEDELGDGPTPTHAGAEGLDDSGGTHRAGRQDARLGVQQHDDDGGVGLDERVEQRDLTSLQVEGCGRAALSRQGDRVAEHDDGEVGALSRRHGLGQLLGVDRRCLRHRRAGLPVGDEGARPGPARGPRSRRRGRA